MITGAVCTSFKEDILRGLHLASATYKIALFTSAATLDDTVDSYTGLSNEVANGGGYTTGGATLAGFDTGSANGTAWLTFNNASWVTATITARGALIYNDSLSGKNAICVIDFGSDITSTSGTFIVTMPTADENSALIRIGS